MQNVRHVSVCLFVWLLQSRRNVMSQSSLSLVSSPKSPLSHSQRLLLELTPFLFAPLHSLPMCLCACKGESMKEEMALSSISLGAPSLSCHHSLAPGTQYSCRGTTLWGTFVSICLQFTVAPIQSSSAAVHATSQKGGERLVLGGSTEGNNREHVFMFGAARWVKFHRGVINLSFAILSR